MDEIAKQLNIQNPQQWYTVTFKLLRQYGATALLNRYNGSPSKLLASVYPEYPSVANLHCFLFFLDAKHCLASRKNKKQCKFDSFEHRSSSFFDISGIFPNLIVFQWDIGTIYLLNGLLWTI